MAADTTIETEEGVIAPQHARGPALSERDGHNPFPIVGIGASAGGLEAFRQLLAGLPATTGMAFVLVQHLDPRHESRLTDLLAKATPMPVLEATHGLGVRPNHVYVIPPNTNMAIAQGLLLLTPRGEGRGPHLPVDYLLRSLAEEQQARAIGVVLSGTGSDGTLGLCEIKAVGGITFAQDDKSARHTGMPLSAVDSGCVDFVLEPEDIAQRLAEIGSHPYLAPVPGKERVQPEVEEQFKRILAIVRSGTGVDFSMYRDTTIRRRIMRRMALHQYQSWSDYVQLLRKDRGEVDALYHDLLINVTSFFRDATMFEALKAQIYPEIIKGKSPSTPFRIWVPGCSAGQEAYSLAISLLEFFDDKPVRPQIQIFATDLADQTALEKARAGVYPETIESEVTPERLRRFFKREDHVYRIDKSIRDMCVFARQNVTSDPPFSHLDMISCRNVLIYLATPLQKRVLPTFHYALNVPGYLVLGTAESVGDNTDLFEMVDRTHKVYAKKAAATRLPIQYGAAAIRGVIDSHSARRHGPFGPGPSDYQREADRMLLGRFAPPGVLVNDRLDIVQFRGRTSPFLEPPPGEPTSNVLKMAREGLFLELRSALTEARKNQRVTQRKSLRVHTDGRIREFDLEVLPVKPPGSTEGCYLILFHDALPAATPVESVTPPIPDRPALEAVPGEPDRALVQLRQELAATKEYLQSLVEQQDAANEELRSANEEILSSNEELQSTNEELETAKEELQSANEELTTVNEQLQHRNTELTQVNNDLTNLMTSTNIPVVMVGGDLRIRRFTAPAKKVLSLLPTDIGRPITDINPAVLMPDLESIISDVIENVRLVEREVRNRDGRWYMLKVYPYRTADHKIDGAVLVLIDIDQARRVQEEMRHQAALLELSQDAIIVRDARNQVTSWNSGAQEIYGWTAEEARGKPLDALLQTDPAVWQEINVRLENAGAWEGELRQIRGDGTPITVYSREVLIRDAEGERSAVLAIKRDITANKRVLEALKAADRRKDEFLATLAHELRNPLSPICNAVEIMRRAGDDSVALDQARGVLYRQVRQLSRIVEDLIDVSRIYEKKIELRPERVTLSSVVETALESCRSVIEGRQHRLRVQLPTEPVYLYADPVRLGQVLINLLNNAAKFTESGGDISLMAELRNESTAASSPGNPGRPGAATHVVIHVRDTGIGIPPELLPNVFDMFTQGDRSLEPTRTGLGIGLSLVRAFVQMHNGDVTVQSPGAGLGSEFMIRLPLAADSRVEPAAKAETKPPAPAGPPPQGRILVVDDNQDQAQSLGMLLQLMGHDVRLAHDGPGAVQAAIEFVPDVALVDIGIPGLNGYDVARRIRMEPKLRKTVLIAQTGWGQDEDRRRSSEAGFDHHMVKPVDIETLLDMVAAAIPPRSGNGGSKR